MTKITFLMAPVVKIIFVVAEITFNVAVITSSVDKKKFVFADF